MKKITVEISGSRYEIARCRDQYTLTYPKKTIASPELVDPDLDPEFDGWIIKTSFFDTIEEVQKALEKIHGRDPLARKVSQPDRLIFLNDVLMNK